MSENWTSLQSRTIDSLRFPMAVAVVMLHHSMKVFEGAEGALKMLCNIFQEGICRLAVPCFFLISSYFFFKGLDRWNWGEWKNKLGRRVRTLLIPYLLWNLIAFIALWLYSRVNSGTSLAEAFYERGGIRMFWSMDGGIPLGVRAAPVDHPLWFIRDLMIYFVAAPLTWLLLHLTKFWGLAALCVAHLVLPGIVPEGFVFFVLGAWFCLSGRNILQTVWPWRWWLAVAAVVLLTVVTLLYGGDEQIRKAVKFFFLLAGIATFFCGFAYLLKEGKMQLRPLLVHSSFFIFATHEILIVEHAARPIVTWLLPEGMLGDCLEFFLTPALGVSICLLLFYVMSKVTPRTLSILCGNRI